MSLSEKWLEYVKRIKSKKNINKNDTHVVTLLNAVIEGEEIAQKN